MKQAVITLYTAGVIISILFFSACSDSVILPEDEIIEAEEEEAIQPDSDPEEPTEETDTMKMTPFKEYDHYFVERGGYVDGITEDKIERIGFEDETGNMLGNPKVFFILDGTAYLSFSVFEQGDPVPGTDPVQYEAVEKEYCFSQKKGKVSEIKSLPDMPEPETVELDEPPFKIVSGEFEEIDISCVFNGTRQINYLPVNGAFVNDEGLWYHVSDSFTVRSGGLYFWKTDDTAGRHRKEIGRLW
jgi:hypothetical protein